MNKKLLLAAAALLVLASCANLDVIGNRAAESFAMLAGSAETEEESGGWRIYAPDGESSFFISPAEEIEMKVSAVPFIIAGLDIITLDKAYKYDEGSLIIKRAFGSGISRDRSIQSSLRHIADKYPEEIGYHSTMDHFSISLGEGSHFNWAQDMSVNNETNSKQDRDMVFSLNPEPFISAGVDPDNIEGWSYRQVDMHIGGKTIKVWKLIKAFDIID